MVTVDGMDEYETIIASNVAGDTAAAEVLDDAVTGNETMPADRAENEALRVSEERYALAVGGAHDALWDWGIEKGVIYTSPRMS